MAQNQLMHAERFVKEQLAGDSSGHDWYHIDRVRKLALHIAAKENQGDRFLIELAALLHDIPDGKLNASEEAGWEKLRNWFDEAGLEEGLRKQIETIIAGVSFSGGQKDLQMIEAAIVQDADRLDAIGAIGIARTFAFGGKKGQAMYDPDIEVRENMTLSEYRQGKSTSVHHFHEKLLKLKGMLNTNTAKIIAADRHAYMEDFLTQFHKEWDVEL